MVLHAVGQDSKLLDAVLVAAALVLPPLIAAIYAFCKIPSEEKLIILLDKNNPDSSGMLVAFQEVGAGAWPEKITIPEVPQVSVDISRRLPVLIIATVFLVCGLIVPNIMPELKTVHKMDISRNVKEIQDDLELLKEEKVISEVEAEQLQESLKELENNATGEDPVKTWEAMDHIKQSILDKAMMSAENTVADVQKLEALAKIAKTLDEKSGKCDPTEFNGAMQELNEALKKLLKDDPELRKMLEKACSGKMSKEALKKLAQACKMNSKKLKEMLNRLQKSGMIKNCNCPNFSNEDLMKFLKQNCTSSEGKQIMGMMPMSIPKPGEGGVERGPGTAPLITHKRDMTFNGKFKDTILTSNDMDITKSQLIGTSAGAPKAGEIRKTSPGQLQSGKIKAGDDTAFTIHPRHRRSVREYFKRKTD